ncbi:Hpt domain-containing protein [Agaribacterium sp. ZY112]|uniref:Hpt domain-containing protein n=1 Tax=Agaribacterium sp. ZY112 TaxID=3233574 RepID=UPI0035264403
MPKSDKNAELVLPSELKTIDFTVKKPDIARRSSSFIRVLGSYIEHNKDTGVQLSVAFANGDNEQLRELIHSVKGASGNLAMQPLYELAAEQETWLRQGASIHKDVFVELIGLFEDSIDDAQRIIDANTVKNDSLANNSDKSSLYAELRVFLQRSEVPEVSLLNRVRDSRADSSQMEALCRALESYDYDDALEILSEDE